MKRPADPEHKPSYNVEGAKSVIKDPAAGMGGRWRRMRGRFGKDAELPPEQLLLRLKKDLRAPRVIVFCNHDGGCTKTTTTAAVGQELATHRRDRIIAVDAADAVGGLSQRLPIQNRSTVQTLLRNIGSVRKWSDARAHTSQGRTGLELLTSGRSIADEDILTADDYRKVISVLTDRDTYNLILVDCDAGVTGELMNEVFRSADLLVIPVAGSDGVAGGVATANRLRYLADKYPDAADHFLGLLRNAIVVLSQLNQRSTVKVDAVRALFTDTIRVRAVKSIPFDPLLQDGQSVDISTISAKTERQFLALAAEIVSALAEQEH
jgi:MinD-like ATPase involved in chromosome partitioning or flagellar assembly